MAALPASQALLKTDTLKSGINFNHGAIKRPVKHSTCFLLVNNVCCKHEITRQQHAGPATCQLFIGSKASQTAALRCHSNPNSNFMISRHHGFTAILGPQLKPWRPSQTGPKLGFPVWPLPLRHSHNRHGSSWTSPSCTHVAASSSPGSTAGTSLLQGMAHLLQKPTRKLQESTAYLGEHLKEMMSLDYWVVRDFQQLVTHVNALEPLLMALSDAQLKAKTQEFRERLKEGETLDDLQAEAFAVVREAARRTLGMRHFDVQIIGGGVLHVGAVAEMRTGEGKTLVATLAAYLNALPGKGVHVVTVNDYLASRDAEWMGRVHRYLGLTVGCIQRGMSEAEKRKQYNCDITYAHNHELGWDYLRDNLLWNATQRVLRWPEPFNYAIIDEIDSVLVDEGRNPMLISRLNNEELEQMRENCIVAALIAAQLVQENGGATILACDAKYKTVDLTAYGVERAERLLEQHMKQKVDLWQQDWAKFILNALKAEVHYLCDRDYILVGQDIRLLDGTSGRAVDKKWPNGIQQAVEAKEYARQGRTVNFTPMQTHAARVSWQGLVRMYPKRAGMTGTGKTEEAEFLEELEMPVVRVPTNKPSRRTDLPMRLMRTKQAKWWAVIDEAYEKAVDGQRPVLIGTTSVSDSQDLSELLKRWRPQHSVLNAKPENAAREAATVAQAGRKGAITIATNMAGRGTDILLGGNPEMLAREILTINIQPHLEGYNEHNPYVGPGFWDIPLTVGTQGAIEAAKHVLRTGVQKVTLAQAKQMIQAAMDRTVQMSPEELEKLKAELAEQDEWSKPSEHMVTPVQGGRNGSVRSQQKELEKHLTVAYSSVLRDCRYVCNRESEFVRQSGGLHVIGTELHESRRIDDQLRGRAGRQGDPGSTQFIISLEDDIFNRGLARFMSMIGGYEDISSPWLHQILLRYQGEVDTLAQSERRAHSKFERIQEDHRLHVYALRQLLVEAPATEIERLMKMYIQAEVDDHIARTCNPSQPIGRWHLTELLAGLQELVGIAQDDTVGNEALLPGWDEESLLRALEAEDPAELARGERQAGPAVDAEEEARWQRIYASCQHLRGRQRMRYALLRRWLGGELIAFYEEILGEEGYSASQRRIALDELDSMWRRHLVVMERLYSGVNVRAFGHVEPLEEYKIEVTRAFARMLRGSLQSTVRRLLNQRVESIPEEPT